MLRKTRLHWTLALAIAAGASAQSEMPATLEIETQDLVIYRHDVFDATKLSTEAGPTTPLPIRTFMNVTWIGDVVAVNGSPAKGTLTIRGAFVGLNRNPTPGTGIADTNNGLASDWIFDIQREDGSAVGTIVASGWAFGTRAAGFAPPGQGNLAVLGGTGAFLGVRGQGKETSVTAGRRNVASVTEDPANRRIHGGRSSRFTFQLAPMVRPGFAATSDMPGVFHADFSPVTATNPARKGEMLIAAATGLGPTIPGKQPQEMFPAEALQQVAAPIQVLVNGVAVNASNQVGWPGTAATYRVDFQMPDDAPSGMATLQMVAAWIPGQTVEIPVR
jgi:hypothetical protein